MTTTQKSTALQLAGNPLRLQILRMLSGSELNLSEIAQKIGKKYVNVSYHCSLLYNANLVKKRYDGTYTFYSLTENGRKLLGFVHFL